MATTNFTNGSTLSDAGWFDDADVVVYPTLTGVAGNNTITAGGPAGMTAYVTGQVFRFIAAGTNSGAVTLNVTPSAGAALGAKNVFNAGAACIGSEIVTGTAVLVIYDSTQFNLIAPSKVVALNVEDQILTGGVKVTSKDLGTIAAGTVTPDPAARPLQHYINGGAHTLGVSANTGSTLVDITNNASAGVITTAAFTKVTGDAFTTINGNKFRCSISVGNAGSLLQVQALQ